MAQINLEEYLDDSTKLYIVDVVDTNKGKNSLGKTTYNRLPVTVINGNVIFKWDSVHYDHGFNSKYLDEHPAYSFVGYTTCEYDIENDSVSFNDESFKISIRKY